MTFNRLLLSIALFMSGALNAMGTQQDSQPLNERCLSLCLTEIRPAEGSTSSESQFERLYALSFNHAPDPGTMNIITLTTPSYDAMIKFAEESLNTGVVNWPFGELVQQPIKDELKNSIARQKELAQLTVAAAWKENPIEKQNDTQ